METLKVKAKAEATGREAQALKDFELIVGTGGAANNEEYALYGIATDDPVTLRRFYEAMLPSAQEAGIADTVDEFAEFWEDPDMVFCIPRKDFDVVED